MISDTEKNKAQLFEEVQTLRSDLGEFHYLFPVIITSLHSDTVLYINDLASRFFELSTRKATELSPQQFWHNQDDRKSFKNHLLKYGRVSKFEASLVTHSGKIKHLLLSAHITTYDDTQAAKIILTDITQKKKAQRALEQSESEAMYRLLADNVRDTIWTTDHNFTITYVTPSIEALTGYTPQEFIKLRKEHCLTPYFQHRFPSVRRFLLKNARRQCPNTHLWEYELQHKDGHTIWVETSTSAIYSRDNTFEGFVCVTRETTDRVKTQRDLELTKEEALSANCAKSEFLANMSHEIRTPMNGVLGMLQLLQNTPLNAEQQKYVDTALSSGTSLLKIISDILDFSKIEAGKIDLEEKCFNLKAVIDTTVSSFEALINNDRVTLETHIDETLPIQIIGDEARLRQILYNLIGNAVKFTTSGAIVVRLLSGGMDKDRVKINFEIQDSGIGISGDKIATIFNPFVQADNSFERRFSGTGLGLSIVKKLVNLMQGDISITSEPQQGTKISFFIHAGLAQDTAAVHQHTSQASGKSMRYQNILVVEDEKINAMVVSAMLKKLGHTPTIADNGHRAIEILKEKSFDCILMDIQMPHMDGIETAQVIRKSRYTNYSEIPIIALTAHAMKGDKERFLKAGMNAYLTKPVEIDSLHSVLHGDSTTT